MLKLKFKQYGYLKKFFYSDLIKIRKFPFSIDADKISKQENLLEENREIKENINNHLNNKILLNNRRAINFLKEDELAFRKKEEYLSNNSQLERREKEKSEIFLGIEEKNFKSIIFKK